MAEAIEQAFIEVIADTSDFAEDLQRDVNRALRNVRRDATREFNRLEDIVANTGGRIRQEVVEALQRISLGFEDVGGDARELAAELGRLRPAFEQLGDRGRAAFQEITRQVEILDERIIAGPLNALRRTGEAADRFGQRFRAALGRAAVSGPELLEESLEDVRRTGQREFDLLETSIRASLGKLGDVPGLERLEAQFERMVDEIRIDFAAATANAEADLREMAARGELSAEQLEDAITKLAVKMDGQLAESIQEVDNNLRRLAGDERIFEELARDIDRAERETEQLQQALLRLERQSHEELANDFNRARIAASGLEEEVEELTSETRQATRATRRFGSEASRATRRANSSFGTLVARMNRLRFVALDLRFILAGVGIFAAARFARFGIEATSAIEQAQLSFQAIARQIEGDVGDSFDVFRDRATSAVAEVIEFARETPFALQEVTDAVRRISAFLPSFKIAEATEIDTLNERVEVSLDLFNDMGGALAVLGQQEALPRLIKAFGDVGAAGRLMGEDLRQIRNALPGINIREAIITGIFDPSVQATEGIAFLREEFSQVGASATESTQDATRQFVDLQRKGLIPVEAVVQGLRVALRDLAGDDALQQFTLTIEGTIEKLREALEVGSARGFQQLGPSLVATVLPALEDLEVAAENFAASMTELAIAVLPLGIDAFETITEIAGEFFTDLANFVANNRTQIQRFFESGAIVVEDLSDGLFVLLDAITPLGPAFLDLVGLGLDVLVPVIESLAPLIRTLAEGIELLPEPVVAAATALFLFRRSLVGIGTVQALLGVTAAGVSSLAAAAARFARFAPALLAVSAFTNFARVAREGKEAAEEFAESLEIDALDPSQEGLSSALEAVNSQLEESRSRVAELQGQIGSAGRAFSIPETFNFIIGLDQFTLIDDLERAQSEVAALEAAFGFFRARFQRNFGFVRDEVLHFADDLGLVVDETRITDQQLEQLLSNMGLSLEDLTEEDLGKFIVALREAFEGTGDFGGALRDVGITIEETDFQKLIDEGTELRDIYSEATKSFADLNNEMLASLDPNFAVIRARADLAEAEQAVSDILEASVGPDGQFADAAEKAEALATAQIDLLEATAKYPATLVALAESLDETDKGLLELEEDMRLLVDLFVENPDIGQGAFDAFLAENDITIAAVRELGEQFPALKPILDTFIAGFESTAERYETAVEGMGLEMVGFRGQVRSSVDGAINKLGEMAPAVRAEMVILETIVSDTSMYNSMLNIGFNAVQGLIDGMQSQRVAAAGAAQGVAQAVLVASRGGRGFEVGSPSKAFRRIGHSVGEGLKLGIDDTRNSVVDSILSISGFRPPTAPMSAAGAPAAPPPGSTSSSSGGFNMPISVTAPRPETAARRVVSEVSDVLYLNTGRSLS